MSPAAAGWRRRALAALALVCVAAQVPGTLALSAAALAAWLLGLALLDRAPLRRMWMPRFWLITLLFALGSGLLLGQRDLQLFGLSLSRAGLEAGALMVVRGALIFGLAAWASQAVSDQQILRAARRLGLPALGRAVPAALKLLPRLEQELRQALAAGGADGGRLRRAWLGAVRIISQTADLARRLAAPAPLLVAVVGPRGVGKTTTVEALVGQLRQAGLTVGGVLQPAMLQQGQRVGYGLQDVGSGEQRMFASRAPEGQRGYRFEQQGWSWARELIAAARRDLDVLVVDELGLLEARGEGHLPALQREAGQRDARVWLLAVRQDRAEEIQRRLGPFDLQHRVGQGQPGDAAGRFVKKIIRRLESEGGVEGG